MGLFGRDRPSRRRPQRKTQTLDEALERSLISKAKKDPTWAERVALRQRKLEDSPADPVEAKKLELKAELLDKALEDVKNDPEQFERYSSRLLDEMFGPEPVYDDEGKYVPTDEWDSRSSFRRLSDELDEFQELREKLGLEDKGQSMIAQLLNTETFKSIGEVLMTKLFGGHAVGNGGGERMYVVSVNGSNVEITESDYNRLRDQGRLTPLGEVKVDRKVIPPAGHDESVQEEPSEPVAETERREPMAEKPPQVSPTHRPGTIHGGEIRSTTPKAPGGIQGGEIDVTGTTMREGQLEDGAAQYGVYGDEAAALPAELLQYIDIEMISRYLEETPDVIVNDIEDGVKKSDDTCMFLWGFLASSTVDGVLGLLAPYRDNEQVGGYIQMLLEDDGRDWLSDVILLIQARESSAKYMQAEEESE